MAREAAEAELTKLRSDGQFSRIYVDVPQPAIVFKALVNQTFTAWDDITSITFDTTTVGAYGDILPDMTLLIGTTSGGHERGIARIRKSATSTIIYIGSVSDIHITDNDYLTVVDEFGIWARHLNATNDVDIHMDEDIAYTDQHKTPDPVPVLGPAVRVAWLEGATVELAFTAAGSWVADGGAITAWEWVATGSSASSGMDTETPTITYNLAGTYRVSCKVTAANTRTFTGYRYVDIINPTAATITEGVKAGGTVTSNGTNVSANDFIIIDGKKYIFVATPTVEGDIDIGANAAETLDNLAYAINHTGTPDTNYKCTAAHPSVEATTNTDTVQTFAARIAGGAGNTITLSKTAATLTLSGSVLTGGLNPISQMKVESVRGSKDDGGWSFEVTVYSGAAYTNIRDRSLVVLFAKDFYGGVESEIGPVPGSENVIAIGWIAGETILRQPDSLEVTFVVQGPQFWLGNEPGFGLGVEDSDYYDNLGGDPTNWREYKDLTVDKLIFHFCRWRSTVTRMMDIFTTGDTRALSKIVNEPGSLWDQLLEIVSASILASPICDRYGRLFLEVDTQFVPTGSRSGFPVIMDITSQDWDEELLIDRITTAPVSLLDIAGSNYSGGENITFYFSRAPGNTFGRFGSFENLEDLVLPTQAIANELCGNIYASMINEYPEIEIFLASNNRLIDIAPRQYVTMSMTASENARGIVWSIKKFIPRNVEFRIDEESGFINTSVTLEAETSGAAGVTVLRPQTPEGGGGGDDDPGPDDWGPGIDDTPFPIPLVPPFGTPPFPGGGGGDGGGDDDGGTVIVDPPGLDDPECKTSSDAEANGPWTIASSRTVYGCNTYITSYMNGFCRPSTFDNPTRYAINLVVYEVNEAGEYVADTDSDAYEIALWGYLPTSGPELVKVAVGVHDEVVAGTSRTGYFEPVAAEGVVFSVITIQLTNCATNPLHFTGVTYGIDEHPWSDGVASGFEYTISADGHYAWAKVQVVWSDARFWTHGPHLYFNGTGTGSRIIVSTSVIEYFWGGGGVKPSFAHGGLNDHWIVGDGLDDNPVIPIGPNWEEDKTYMSGTTVGIWQNYWCGSWIESTHGLCLTLYASVRTMENKMSVLGAWIYNICSAD